MSQFLLYFGAFLAAVAVIVLGSHFVWKRQVAALPTPPYWMEAFHVIWVEWYAMPWNSRPRVIWVPGRGFRNSAGEFVAGESDGNSVTCAAADEGTPVSSLALAHELWHVALRLRGMDPDGGHTGAAWRPSGIVDRTNAALRARGW